MEHADKDYLKYYPVIKKFIKDNYKITEATLSIMMFLYSEQYFNKDKFEEFNSLICWDRTRISAMQRDGWISVFRKGNGTKHSTLYQLSIKSKNLVKLMYDMLNGERIAISALNNRMFMQSAGYSSKVHRSMLKKMRQYSMERRKEQHPMLNGKYVKAK